MVELVTYPLFYDFLKEQIKERITLKEAIKKFESWGGKRISHVEYCRKAHKAAQAGFIQVVRHEQLFLSPSMDSLKINPQYHRNNIPTIEVTKPMHSQHRTLLSMSYQGIQPTKGSSYTKPFGRYKTAIQSVYKRGPLTITAFKNKLNVWVHGSKGFRTNEQVINAKVQGYNELQLFAKEHNLVLDGYLDKVLLSHHVLENKEANDLLKPLFKQYGDEIEARLGSVVETASHPDKIQHQGKGRPDRIVRGDKVAEGLEYLTLDYPNDFAKFAKLIPEYEKQLKLHLEVESETLNTLKLIQKSLKK